MKIAPRVEDGCDYGVAGVVLAENKTHRLIWRKGHLTWGGVGQSRLYAPAELELAGDEWMHKRLQEGGRLSMKMLRQHAARIDEVFGVGATEKLCIHETRTFE